MRTALMTITLAGLAACTPSPGWNIVHTTVIDPIYRAEDVRITGAPLPTLIVGAAPDGSSPEATLAELTLPSRLGGRPARAQAEGDYRDLRLVFAYSPLPVTRICDADISAGGGQLGSKAGSVEISAALCRGNRLHSYGILNTAARGPSDPGFRKATLQLLNAIMPIGNEYLITVRPTGSD